MSSMTRRGTGSALAERVDALEAERLAPVPRASHAVAIDATDLILVLDHLRVLRARLTGSRPDAEVAAACGRLDAVARPHAARTTR